MHGEAIKISGFFFVSLKFDYYYLQYAPASKPFEHAWFEVLEAIKLYCTWSDNR